jgi:imidazolonepropionase-like amidohydrolase
VISCTSTGSLAGFRSLAASSEIRANPAWTERLKPQLRRGRILPTMRIQWALFLSVILLASSTARTADLALIDTKVYPSPTDTPIENGSILIRDGRIVSVGLSSTIKIPRSAKFIDCKGLVVTAGFWNNHVHILTPALLHVGDSGAEALDQELDTVFNRWGFTTVFDLSSVFDNTVRLRRRIESGELRGPHILTVGEPIWTIEPAYVRAFLKAHDIHIANTETPDQAIALVRDHAAKGADGIKLFTGSYQGGSKVAVLPLEVAKAAVAEAHRHNLPVFAHPQNVEGINVAVDSGVDVLAHTVPQSPPWTQDFVLRLIGAHLALIPTLTLYDFETRKQNRPDEEREAFIRKMVAELRAYSQASGDILFGTDIGYSDHYDTAMEFTLMSAAGMNYQQILASLTTNPARKFRYSTRTGRIAKGVDTDLVVLSTDPAQDVTAFSKVRYTIRNGQVLYQEK